MCNGTARCASQGGELGLASVRASAKGAGRSPKPSRRGSIPRARATAEKLKDTLSFALSSS
jgi:hypothetical protein